MNSPNLLTEATDRALEESAKIRGELQFAEVFFLGAMGVTDPGRHFANYANMIFNRILTLYDDCEMLVSHKRTSAACVMARCIIETYAVGEFAMYEVAKGFNSGGLEKAGGTVLSYVNSSRIKVEEQKRFKKGSFSEEAYHLTPDALARMEKEEAASKHILDAMRHLFKQEMKISSRNESEFELLYEQLSEWTHPSQTSLFHAFAKDAWLIETSAGRLSFWDGARAGCGKAMHFIVAAEDLRERMTEVANSLSATFEADESCIRL